MAADVRAALAAALRAALGARDMPAAAALRSALAAIANAEAVSGDAVHAVPVPRPGTSRIAMASAGLGSTEVPRRVLDEAIIRGIVSNEITERRQAADQYAAAGHVSYADRLTAEANVLQAVLAALYRGVRPMRPALPAGRQQQDQDRGRHLLRRAAVKMHSGAGR
jgi:uncharacterized protein